MFPILKVKEGDGTAGHTQPNVEIQHFHPKVREIIRTAMLDNRLNSLAYQLKQRARAFLQGESDDWLLIEFWNTDPSAHMPFVDYLNEQIIAERSKY